MRRPQCSSRLTMLSASPISRLSRSKPSTTNTSKRLASESASSALPPGRSATGVLPLTPSSACVATTCQPSASVRARAARSWSSLLFSDCLSVLYLAYRQALCVIAQVLPRRRLRDGVTQHLFGQQLDQLRARGAALVGRSGRLHVKCAVRPGLRPGGLRRPSRGSALRSTPRPRSPWPGRSLRPAGPSPARLPWPAGIPGR